MHIEVMKMKPLNTSKRLQEIMAIKNLRQIDILNLAEPIGKKHGIKLTKTDLTQYVSGKTEPGPNKLWLLGQVLDVSEAWLIGLDVPMHRLKGDKHEQPFQVAPLTSNETTLILNYRELNLLGKEKAQEYMTDLTENEKYTK